MSLNLQGPGDKLAAKGSKRKWEKSCSSVQEDEDGSGVHMATGDPTCSRLCNTSVPYVSKGEFKEKY
ncbi:unnamed protein product [Pleuronectes platessa]|uniref:Uncharacterized protein n=1 Tax=Pleuronectes platessa TaxID=8262 RepID=A0A9N7YXW2_PLEPL|nr:unnamed protein product [Pleuronectes platessa]